MFEEVSANDISFSNIAQIEAKIEKFNQLITCELAEISLYFAEHIIELASLKLSFSEIFTIISDELFSLPDNCHIIGKSNEIGFVNTLYARLNENNIYLSESDILPTVPKEDSFTYVKNYLADEAYDVFSQEFEDPRVAYSQNFKEAAHSASVKKAGYCILPLEEKGGIRIPGISSIIFSEDLKINAITPVFGFDGNADMKYALLSSAFDIPAYEAGDDRFLEILIPKEENSILSSLLLAAESFGCNIFRIATNNFESEGSQYLYYSIIFKTKESCFTKLLIYLSLFCRDYIPIGLYKNLE